MLYVIIGLILVIVLVLSYGAWMRKKSYSAIDQAEERRMTLVSRPVAQELAKIKKLKMAGDTEKKFEKWRAAWDKMITTELPDIEQRLFKCEELTDKYHFKKAAGEIKNLHEQMNGIETRIEQIIAELNRVVDSERENRDDIQAVKETYHSVKKGMITKRSLFAETLPQLDQEVKAIDDVYKTFASETEQGNYIEARNCLLQVKKDLEIVSHQMEQIPALYEEAKKTIPEQLKELLNGKNEMEEKGYALGNLQIDVQVEETEKQVQTILDAIAHMELKEAAAAVSACHEQIDFLFAQMEKEVLSRQELQQLVPSVDEKINQVNQKVTQLVSDTDAVKNSYHIDVTDLKTQLSIAKSFDKLQKDYTELTALREAGDQAFSLLLDKMKTIQKSMETIETSTEAFNRKIKALRKDELAARETVKELKHLLFDVRRMIQQSNLFGVPLAFREALTQAGHALDTVNAALDQSPLTMSDVLQALSAAKTAVSDVHQDAQKLIDTAKFAEEMIRYGNRYRSDSVEINQELSEAEHLFRKLEYEAAAEMAVHAIERKEPKLLKRMDLYDDVKSQA
ncbi:MAG: septation ring formation regulator EzrA [Sporolactobacillus sp.]